MPSCFKDLVQRPQSYHNFTKKKIIITEKNLKLNLVICIFIRETQNERENFKKVKSDEDTRLIGVFLKKRKPLIGDF